MNNKVEAQTILDSRYARHGTAGMYHSADPWLTRWMHIIETGRNDKVLDLGCGSGPDSRFLSEQGYEVVAADYSPEALRLCRQAAPRATQHEVDLRDPLPFPDREFRIVIASLSLHYFSWDLTLRIMTEIRRCVQPAGYLLIRVNSNRDIHHGAGDYRELEPNLLLVGGEMVKRFFDRDGVTRLIAGDWITLNIEEMTVNKYTSPKVLWEVVLQRPPEKQIYDVVSRIPRGFVATYGQVARLAGLPGRARQVGYALSALTGRSSLPWHRVINARGEISPRSGGSPGGHVQRFRLEEEGVKFDGSGRIALDIYQWQPGTGNDADNPPTGSQP